ncbi:HDOD domain-containing protein [Alkalilimnicola ehrlichii]|uniref:HDOD domain-containing protein n=1 Tax=Alkalilimnicola ehrlichii TaxID=351052 RepID=UPI003BA25D44
MIAIPDEARLAKLTPLNELSGERLSRLREKGGLARVHRGETLQAPNEDRNLVYLLEGQLTLVSRGGGVERIKGGDDGACQPLFDGRPRQTVARADRDCIILRLPRPLFDVLADEERNAGYDVREVQVDESGMRLFQRILHHLRDGSLELPVMPEITMRLKALPEEEADLETLSDIVRLDPSVAARVIHASNSPVYRRSAGPISSLREAVAMLGFITVKKLALAMTLSAPFERQSPSARRLLKRTWRYSVCASVTAAVIAQRSAAGLDRDRCLLAGLTHSIGVVPIVMFAERAGIHDSQGLAEAIEGLSGMVGREVLEAWEFDEALAEVPEHVADPMRAHDGPADLADAVIVARLFCDANAGDEAALKTLHATPALTRLQLPGNGPEADLEVLHAARAELEALEKALMGEA